MHGVTVSLNVWSDRTEATVTLTRDGWGYGPHFVQKFAHSEETGIEGERDALARSLRAMADAIERGEGL